MIEDIRKPDVGNFRVKSETSRQIASVSFMAICIVTATVAIVILISLLLSIGAKGIQALAPREDALLNHLNLNIVQGSNDENDPGKFDNGDLLLGVFVVERFEKGGLGKKNDTVLTGPAGESEQEGFDSAPLIGVFSFQVNGVHSQDDSAAVSFEAAAGDNSVLSILQKGGCDTGSLNMPTAKNTAIALLESTDPEFDVAKILSEFKELDANGLANVLNSAANPWKVKFLAGYGTDQDFLNLGLRSTLFLDTKEIAGLRSKKKFGRFDGCFTVLSHDLEENRSFQTITMNSPIEGSDMVSGQLLWQDGKLTKLRSRTSDSAFTGKSVVSLNVVPEDESAVDYLAHYLTAPPVNDPYDAGIGPALMGTIWVCIGCALFALPLGIGTAIFLEEMKPSGKWMMRFHGFVQLNISNLAGVPSIVYGLLGLIAFGSMFGLFGKENNPTLEFGATHQYQYLTEGNSVVFVPVKSRDDQPVFEPGSFPAFNGDGEPVDLNIIGENDEYPDDDELLKRTLYADAEGGPYTQTPWYYFRLPFGRGVLAASLTLMLVILPVVIIASQESFRAVPSSLREAAMGVGATQWQVIRNVTLPAAIPGIMTGAILSTSRAIGEAAPLLVLAGIVYITSGPGHLMDFYSVMPIQIYYWAGLPVDRSEAVNFQHVAALGIMILLGILLTFNGIAIAIRQRTQKPLT